MKFKERAKRKKIFHTLSPSNSSNGEDPASKIGETTFPSPKTPRPEASFKCFAYIEVEATYRTIFSFRHV